MTTKVADELQADGANAVGVAVDVTDVDSTPRTGRRGRRCVRRDRHPGEQRGHHARELPQYGLSNMPVDEWDRVIDVNLRGPLLCTQAVVPSMTERGGGRIINGLSAGAFMAGGIYGISKYALHTLTANLASELGLGAST